MDFHRLISLQNGTLDPGERGEAGEEGEEETDDEEVEEGEEEEADEEEEDSTPAGCVIEDRTVEEEEEEEELETSALEDDRADETMAKRRGCFGPKVTGNDILLASCGELHGEIESSQLVSSTLEECKICGVLETCSVREKRKITRLLEALEVYGNHRLLPTWTFFRNHRATIPSLRQLTKREFGVHLNHTMRAARSDGSLEEDVLHKLLFSQYSQYTYLEPYCYVLTTLRNGCKTIYPNQSVLDATRSQCNTIIKIIKQLQAIRNVSAAKKRGKEDG
ncbi:UNVERIFIED_CONTAM: hypothetical protein FKN15_019057 [Acipenser sinensis]